MGCTAEGREVRQKRDEKGLVVSTEEEAQGKTEQGREVR